MRFQLGRRFFRKLVIAIFSVASLQLLFIYTTKDNKYEPWFKAGQRTSLSVGGYDLITKIGADDTVNLTRALDEQVGSPPRALAAGGLLVGNGPATGWRQSSFCDGRLIFFESYMALFRNVSFDKARVHGLPGGQDLTEIMNIAEKKEFYNLDPGTFKLQCSKSMHVKLPALESFLNDYLKTLTRVTSINDATNAVTVIEPTIMLTRFEYANVYWAMIDLYSAYVTLRTFGINPAEQKVSVLLLDGHPKSSLDPLWDSIFSKVYRVGAMPPVTRFSTLFWQHLRPKAHLMNKHNNAPVFLEEFSSHVLVGCGLERLPLSCQNSTIKFIWRHDYVAHPRNPQGKVKRKFGNEEQLLMEVAKAFPDYKVQGQQLDKWVPCEQLAYLANADIVVAMHGAAVTYSLFMKPGATFIEIYPPSYRTANWHMTKIGQWAKLQHFEWLIKNRRLENIGLQKTYVPTEELVSHIRNHLPVC